MPQPLEAVPQGGVAIATGTVPLVQGENVNDILSRNVKAFPEDKCIRDEAAATS